MLRKFIAFLLVAVIFGVTAPKHGLHELLGHVETQHAHHAHGEEEHIHNDFTIESVHNHCDCYDFDAPLLIKSNFYITVLVSTYGKNIALAVQNLV